MEDAKPWWQSKAIWGAIVTLGAAGLTLFHYSISPADQASVVDLVAGIGNAVGGLVALFGRVMATKQVGA